ncbi:MAG TPA: DMT family transporter [Streptosporangiaceae bacterium]|nr:DMT family transporter [Streptosporangiaceae bacterium]
MVYVLGVLAAMLLGTGFVLQQGAARQVPAADFLRLRLVADLMRKPRWLAGIATMILGQLLAAWVEGHIVLAVSAPLLATNLLVALSLAWPLSGQPITASEAVGAVVLLAGVIALSVAQSVPASRDVVGSPRYWPYCGAAVAVLAAGFAGAGWWRTGGLRAVLVGTGAGLVFGTQDAITRLVVDAAGGIHQLAVLLTGWPVYALVAVGATGLWLMQNAFSAAPLHVCLPPMTAVEPVWAMVLGIVVFRERVPVSPAMIALQVAGLAALVAGVVLVARAPALSALHHAPHDKRAHLLAVSLASLSLTGYGWRT